jgi:signal transduction histidine kinase
MIAIEPLFEQLTDGVCISDAEGNVLYMNPAAKRMLGVQEPQTEILNTCQLLCGRLFARGSESCAERCSLREKASADTQVTFQGRHGPLPMYEWKDIGVKRVEHWNHLRVRCLKAPGSSFGLGDEERHFTLIEDASAEMELERSKEDWRNMVAHDLRSPLTNVTTTLLLIQEAGGRALSQKESQLLEIAVRSGRKISDLLELYLDIARLDARMMPLRKDLLALEPLLRKAVEEHSAVAGSKGVFLETSVEPSATACADADLLARVVDNLLGNAVKFTPQGGRVTVSARAEAVATICIKDTGPGIAAEDIPLIFDRYHQARARREGKIKGNGLGLAFCREALKAMGGEIGVRSQPGLGSEFVVTLPAAS